MPIGRPKKPVKDRAVNAGYTAYPKEIEAIRRASVTKKYRSPFDYLRALVIEDLPAAEGKLMSPARMKQGIQN